MEANELRIGNYLTNFLGEVFEANGVTIGNFYNNEFGLPEPILLTEEWLLKFGFEYLADSQFIKETDTLQFNWDNITGLYLYEKDEIHGIELEHIKYLHQLQNLYFALTNNELTIKK